MTVIVTREIENHKTTRTILVVMTGNTATRHAALPNAAP